MGSLRKVKNATAAGKKIAWKIAVGLNEPHIRLTKSLVHLSPKETAVPARVHVAPILVLLFREKSVWMTMAAEKRVFVMAPHPVVLCPKLDPTRPFATKNLSVIRVNAQVRIGIGVLGRRRKPVQQAYYRLGQANLEFSLCQDLGILVIFDPFKCGVFSKIKSQNLQNDQNCRL